MLAAARQQGMKKTGVSISVGNDDYSRLSYYLHCATKAVGIDILPDELIDYNNAWSLSRESKDAILKLAYEIIGPDTTVGKVFYPEQGGLCGTSSNEFFEVTQVDTIFAVASSVVIGGERTQVAKIMVFQQSWLNRNYHQPIKNQMKRIRQVCDVKDDDDGDLSSVFARILLAAIVDDDGGATTSSNHCSHCRGLDGSCGCNHGCGIKAQTKCSKVHHCDHCKGFDGAKCVCKHGCVEGMYSKCVVVHTGTTCDGCMKEDMKGVRFKCTTCSNFDLCENCYNQGARNHDMSHPFARIDRVGSDRVQLSARERPKPRPAPSTPSPRNNASNSQAAYQTAKVVTPEPDFVVMPQATAPIISTATPIYPSSSFGSTNTMGDFSVGDSVILVGLQKAAHMNGVSAEVKHNAQMMGGGRIQIMLTDSSRPDTAGKLMCVKPENLQKVQTFQSGQMVAFKDLSNKEMNGTMGMVECCIPGGRVQVRLYEGKTVSIKPENLDVVADILD